MVVQLKLGRRMGKQSFRLIIAYLLLSNFLIFSQENLIFSQERKIKTIISDRLKFEAEVEAILYDSLKVETVKAKRVSLLREDQKLVDMSFWAIETIRKMMIKQNNNNYLLLGFNYLGGIISQRQYKFIDNEFIADGVHYFYDDNGILTNFYTYKNDKLNGKYNIYYKNGKLRSTGQYINDVEVGTWVEYSLGGKILKKINYKQIGKSN